jgi:uncharacterized membrane protein
MKLSEAGQARLRGYVWLLDRSLRTRLPHGEAREALKEIEGHIHARIAETDAASDEKLALERILAELGAPLRVAQAYSADKNLDDAVQTGRLPAIFRSIANAAFATVFGFMAAIVLFTGYASGMAFLIIGLAKPIFPNNVGFWMVNGPVSIPTSLGFKWNTTETPAGGNWVIVIGLAGGVTILALTHWGARAFLRWYRARRAPEYPLIA